MVTFLLSVTFNNLYLFVEEVFLFNIGGSIPILSGHTQSTLAASHINGYMKVIEVQAVTYRKTFDFILER